MINTATLRGKKVQITSEDNKVIEMVGDKTLIEILRPLFNSTVTTRTAEEVKKKGVEEILEKEIVLKPGDENYIIVVLLDKVQNELGMDVE